MKHFKHPATVIAALALFVAASGGAAAYAAGLIDGAKIKDHTIATKKLTNAAIKQLQGAPAGKIIVYNAQANLAPTYTPLATILGDTFTAACVLDGSGNVTVAVKIQTSDGSWYVDYGYAATDNGNSFQVADTRVYSVGGISSPTIVDFAKAGAGGKTANHHIEYIQLGPESGRMIWQELATTVVSNSCHISIEYVPETVTFAAGSLRHSPAPIPGRPLLLPRN